MEKVNFKPGYSVSDKGLHCNIYQDRFSTKNQNFTRINKKQIVLVNLELKEMSKKGEIKKTQPVQGEFLSNLVLNGIKDGSYHSVINLKTLNYFVPFLHFQMEDLSHLKYLID